MFFHQTDREKGGRGAFQFWRVGQKIIGWFQAFCIGIFENSIQISFGFTGNECKPIGQRLLNIRRHLFQHGKTSTHMKASNDHGNTGLKKRFPYIQGTRKLVGLHTDKTDHASESMTNALNNSLCGDYSMAVVMKLHNNVDVLSQHLSLHTVHG